MICWTSRVSRSLSVCIRPANRGHRLGVVGGLLHRLGEQVERADRGLQLVADVGDEVAADRLDPALAGAVLDQRQHQPAAQRRHPGGDVQRRDGPAARHHQLGLADLPVAAYLPDQVGELLRRRPRLPRTSPRAYAGAEALSTSSFSSTTRALEREHGEHGGDAGGHGGLVGAAAAVVHAGAR